MSGFGGLFEFPVGPVLRGRTASALSGGALSNKLKRRMQNMARAVEKSDLDLLSSLHSEKA
ncbi:MAG: hypothetical protein LBL35_03275 [Clostridiales bacterium]|nr:hypothetical protein [Clostridiales bacterium]